MYGLRFTWCDLAEKYYVYINFTPPFVIIYWGDGTKKSSRSLAIMLGVLRLNPTMPTTFWCQAEKIYINPLISCWEYDTNESSPSV